MKILSLTEKNWDTVIDETCTVLDAGGLVVLPSDTVYGLAVRADSSKAVARLNTWKARLTGKAISVCVPSLEEAQKFVHMTESQKATLSHMLPGPFTVVLPSKHTLAIELESEHGTLGIRIPKNDFIHMLMQKYGKPITATSANLAGKGPHYSVVDLFNTLSEKKKDMLDLVIDAGVLPRRKPSTVVDMTGGDIEILRQGDGHIDEVLVSTSEDATKKYAAELLERYQTHVDKKPMIFLLYGDVGAGKTQFVKGIGTALGIDSIVSPTFVIYYEYPVHVENSPVNFLYHYDLYRLQNIEEFEHIGIDDILRPGVVTCIEWSERGSAIEERLIKEATVVKIHIEHTSETTRTLKFSKLS